MFLLWVCRKLQHQGNISWSDLRVTRVVHIYIIHRRRTHRKKPPQINFLCATDQRLVGWCPNRGGVGEAVIPGVRAGDRGCSVSFDCVGYRHANTSSIDTRADCQTDCVTSLWRQIESVSVAQAERLEPVLFSVTAFEQQSMVAVRV